MSVQTPGFSLALGMVVHGLSMSGHGKAEDIHSRLLAAWIKILLSEVLQLHFFYCTATLDTQIYWTKFSPYWCAMTMIHLTVQASQTSATSCFRVSGCCQCCSEYHRLAFKVSVKITSEYLKLCGADFDGSNTSKKSHTDSRYSSHPTDKSWAASKLSLSCKLYSITCSLSFVLLKCAAAWRQHFTGNT